MYSCTSYRSYTKLFFSKKNLYCTRIKAASRNIDRATPYHPRATSRRRTPTRPGPAAIRAGRAGRLGRSRSPPPDMTHKPTALALVSDLNTERVLPAKPPPPLRPLPALIFGSRRPAFAAPRPALPRVRESINVLFQPLCLNVIFNAASIC